MNPSVVSPPTSVRQSAGAELARAVRLANSGRAAEAEHVLLRAIAAHPAATAARLRLAGMAMARGDVQAAERALADGLPHDSSADLRHALGLLYLRQRRHTQARETLRAAVDREPGNAVFRANLGIAQHRLGCLHEAIATYRNALADAPDMVSTRSNLANALKDIGDSAGAIAEYGLAIEQEPANLGLVSSLLWAHCHRDDVDGESLYRLHRDLGQRFGQPEPAAFEHRASDALLKVGFVSADLRDHPVAFFIEPVWRALDRQRFSVHVYDCSPSRDAVSERLRPLADHWVDATRLDDAALHQRIRADGIDVLVDLSGHTSGNRLRVFARRAAPVQASWIGYPCTTGVQAMDYFLSDPWMAPPGTIDQAFPEKIVRLSAAACFDPPAFLPDVRPLPALSRGSVTFGSFHRRAKLGDATVRAWAQLLSRLPDARLVLCDCADEEDVRGSLLSRFQALGVEPGRLRFLPRLPLADFLALHDEVDLALDAFSFSGGTTTLHSLFMGVPVITAQGRTMPGRQTATILAHAGLDDFVAASPEGFVDLAAGWAQRLDELGELRLRLRDSLRERPLLRDSQVPRAFASAITAMHDRWQRGLPPAALSVDAAGGVRTQDGQP